MRIFSVVSGLAISNSEKNDPLNLSYSLRNGVIILNLGLVLEMKIHSFTDTVYFLLQILILDKNVSEAAKKVKKDILKNFKIFTGKHLCWSPFLIKLKEKEHNFFEKRLQHRCVPVNIMEYLGTPTCFLLQKFLLEHEPQNPKNL